MDMSKMSQGQMIAGVGGIVLLISLFLEWISGISITVPGGASVSGGGGSAFDVFSGMDIIMLIVAIVSILWAASAASGRAVPPQSALIVGLLGVAIVGFALGNELEDSNAGIGAWLGLFGSIAIAWGALAGGRQPAAAPASRAAAPPPPPAAPAA